MANIDVSELMADPDFVDPVEVIRNGVSVSLDGLTEATAQDMGTILASMQPASHKELMLLPEGQRVSGMLSCWTNFPLQEAREASEADIIVWKKQRYRVVKLSDWQHFGNGYTHGLVEQIGVLEEGSCCDAQY